MSDLKPWHDTVACPRCKVRVVVPMHDPVDLDIRNARMIEVVRALAECGWTVKVLAFPGPDSRGTWNLVRLAREAGFTPFVEELV